MADSATPIATLLEQAEEYSNTTFELLKLKAIARSADIVSSLVSQLAVIIIVALSLFIISIGFAFWVGKLTGAVFYGFFITGGVYALFAIILYGFRHRWIKFPVSNTIIEKMLH